MRKKIKKKQLENGIIPSTGLELSLDTTNFNDNLDNTVTDIQKLADKVDDLNTVHTYETLPPEIESQIAYNQGKMYYGDGSEWKELGGEKLPDGVINNTLVHNGTTWVTNARIQSFVNSYNQAVVDFIYTSTGTKTRIYGDGSNCSIEIYKENNRDSACTRLGNYTSGSNSSGSLMIWSKESQISLLSKEPYGTNPAIIYYNGADYSDANIKFRVMPNGEILSKTLSGTTSSLIEALPDGTIQRSSQTIPPTQIQSDWNQTNNTQADYIKNKPTIPAGLPSGTVNQTLRHNGTSWTANSRLSIGDIVTSGSSGYKVALS